MFDFTQFDFMFFTCLVPCIAYLTMFMLVLYLRSIGESHVSSILQNCTRDGELDNMNWKIFSLAVLIVLSLSVACYDFKVFFSPSYDLFIGVLLWDPVSNAIPIDAFDSTSTSGQPYADVGEVRSLLQSGASLPGWLEFPAYPNSPSSLSGWVEAMYKKYVGHQAVPASIRTEAAFYVQDGNNYYLVELWKYPDVPPLFLTIGFNVVTVFLWLVFGSRKMESALPD